MLKATALHELAHWTGHPSRLNRSTLTDSYRFGDVNYAKEELRAELASVFVAAETGIPHEPAKHAAYVGHWIKALKDDKNEIFRAAHDASAASDYVLNLQREVSKARSAEMSEGSSVDRVRDETEALENDRDEFASSGASKTSGRTPESEERESSRFVARFESNTGTVAVHDKQTGTDRHTPTESSRSSATGHPEEHSDREALHASFSDTKGLTAAKLGDGARTYTAQTQSGNYRGEIIAETDLHVVQRLSSQSAVAHVKQFLDPVPRVGERAAIAYANERASVKEWRERSRTQELAR